MSVNNCRLRPRHLTERRANPFPMPFQPPSTHQFTSRIPRPPLATLIDHLHHITQVAGIDHVGLGSDFDGIPDTPAGIDSAADLPRITEALYERGYTAEQLHKLLGGNLLRVFEQIQTLGG